MPGKKPKAKPVAVDRQASRQHSGSQKSTALAPPMEYRKIVLFQGLQFDNTMLKEDWRVPDYLKKKLGSALKIVTPRGMGKGKHLASYVSAEQGVRFSIKVTMDKDEFKEALQTKNLHVVYAGHARYGRGPCFGFMPEKPNDEGIGGSPRRTYRGENWAEGESATADKTGWLRMGYPYLPTPASEIIHYGYTPNLVEVRKGRPAKAKCHPEIQGNYGKLHAYSIPEIAQALERQWHAEYRQAHKVIDKEDSFEHVHELELQLWDDSSFGLDALEIGDNKDCYERRLERCIGVPADAGYRFWGYDAYSKGALKRFLIHDAGWRNTVSVPWDLGATDMQCRVLCHFGCSTLKHNRPIIRGKNHKNWRQEDDDHYGFFTDATAYMMTASRWIYHLLTYPEYNAFEPWKDSLKYAREQTNTDLKNMKQKFRIRAG